MVALWAMAIAALATIPLAKPLRDAPGPAAPPAPGEERGLKAQLAVSFSDPSYWCLHLGFFTCGFHIAFLVTHLPGEVGLCGLAATVSAASLAIIGLSNIVGSLGAGWLSQKHSMKMILFWMYASRAVAVGIYLMLPKEPWTFYAFAVVLGLTWLATVPPTAGLVAKLFGVRYLATLFGFTLLSHQIGGFFGAWLGGLALAGTGSYDWMWYADIVLALIAAVANLPIREAPVRPAAQARIAALTCCGCSWITQWLPSGMRSMRRSGTSSSSPSSSTVPSAVSASPQITRVGTRTVSAAGSSTSARRRGRRASADRAARRGRG
jgi:MFS family permease